MSRALALLMAVLAATPSVAGDEFRFYQAVEVVQAGWVRVPLEGPVLKYADLDLAVLDPQGVPLPLRLERGSGDPRQVRVTDARRHAGGWRLTLDAGPEPPPHSRLYFDLARVGDAAGCELEASADGLEWRHLATADLFRLGEGPDLASNLIDYPQSRDRFLRLAWHTESLPHVLNLRLGVLAPPGDSHQVDAECVAAGSGLSCLLPLPEPAHLLRRLDVEIGGAREEAIGFRLWLPEDGSWRQVAEGVRYGASTLRLPLDRSPPKRFARQARLELHRAGPASPVLEAARFQAIPMSLVFRATTAGRHRLAFGRSAPAVSATETATPASRPALVALQPILGGDWPPWPEHLVAPANPPDQSWRPTHRWPIQAPRAQGGEVVALELTAAVLEAAGPRLASLRLEAAGRLLPFVAVTPESPARIGRWRVEPTPAEGGSRAEILLPATATDLSLRASGPFERRIRGRFEEPSRPGVDGRGGSAFAAQVWRCPSAGPLPCLLSRSVARPRWSQGPILPLHLLIDDGDNPPLAELRIEAFGRRGRLLLVWPATPVTLLAGDTKLRPASYDLRALESLLRSRPAIEARLGDPEPLEQTPSWPPWLLPVAFGLAALVLVWLLSRMVRETETETETGTGG